MVSEVEFIFRPVEVWPGEPTEEPSPSPFGGRGKKYLPYSDLMTALRREMRMLGVERAIIQLHLTEREIRRDNLPRRDARPSRPGVVISAEIPDVGWRSFFTDSYDVWQANLQALVRGFEMSRALERDGFAKNKDQYRGFPALEAPGNGIVPAADDREWAESVLLSEAQVPKDLVSRERSDAEWKRVSKVALMNAHPDHGGDTDRKMRVERASKVLGI